ncbi:MAG: hypothetical protein KAW88_05755 [Candidatus Cloacimonetes bacterium]|nr:hypothetical protein [Candidatus Cloacimonadota bacterium]
MSNFTKTVLCILLIILFTSSVYGKKKIDVSNKLVISFSKEGYGDVIAPSFFGSTSR